MKTKIFLWVLVLGFAALVIFPVMGRIGLALSRSMDMAPFDLNVAPRPLVVVACNEQGLILRDATGKIYSYPGGDVFAATAFKQNFKPGDVFCPLNP